MTDPVREAFEQWVLREYGRDYPDPQVLLERNSLNDYAMNRVRDAWPSWQASRALALEQLEAMCAIKAGVVVGEAAAQYLRGRQDCVDLIRALKEGV